MKYSEYLAMLKKYEEQQRLEQYQRERVLVRPPTTKLRLTLWGLLLLVTLALLIFFILSLPIIPLIKVAVSVASIALFLEFALRFIGIKAVQCYQHYASEERRRRCLCVPSCSEYAILCFKKFELILALVKIRKRLYVTCKDGEYKIDSP